MPVKAAKFIAGYQSNKETSRLKAAELERDLRGLLAIGGIISPAASRGDCVFELVSLRACHLRGARPQFRSGIASLICDTEKAVRSNRDAAVELAMYASAVDRASAVDNALTRSSSANGALRCIPSVMCLRVLSVFDVLESSSECRYWPLGLPPPHPLSCSSPSYLLPVLGLVFPFSPLSPHLDLVLFSLPSRPRPRSRIFRFGLASAEDLRTFLCDDAEHQLYTVTFSPRR
ncbi:hypothetical protein B0H17DRAFT_15704 [Mycena rosella]|uniref:Uncharacterized protein n=1 Tax=Mycena rosella TaxID=1033263 RepID=A0AAD7FBM5_MYCRO|nr:hypothetical protein B0H17DRAFT_15704 [Mycena rosella]